MYGKPALYNGKKHGAVIEMSKRGLTTTRIIMLGFLAAIAVGTVCLMLPVSLRQGRSMEFTDALFVAVSSVCVTGLSTVNVGQTFSGFGQTVLLLLIQLGGLGIVTFTTTVLLLLRRKITLADRMLIQSAYNLDTLSGLVRLTLRIVKVTACIEGIGALCYCLVFVPEYGAVGLWYGVFHSVSAFCNAGLDLLGGNSFCAYADNVIINFTTMLLVAAGGLGFPVYWELARCLFGGRGGHARRMSLHARLVLAVTAALLILGAALTLLFEYDNPKTLGPMSLPNKLMAAFFQSVTLRTAGFAAVPQENFTSASSMSYLALMFIGGSPGGTAGGVKTVTVVVLLASMLANIRGRTAVSIFCRRITDETVRRCVAIIAFSFTVLLVLTTALLAVERSAFLDTLYEMTSAIATVGLSRGLTGGLSAAGKLIVSLAMYLGRIGPITLALAFNSGRPAQKTAWAQGRVIIG